MPTISDALASAFQYHQAGEFEVAEQIYRQVLAVAPDSADALHLLGLVSFQTGKYGAAAELIERAIELKPDEAGYHGNLGNAYKAIGKIDQAIACYRRALEVNPGYAVGHFNLATALRDQNKLEDAVVSFQRAAQLRPEHAETHSSLGNVRQALGQWDQAIQSFRRALEIKPSDAGYHYNLANALQKNGQLSEAIDYYHRAIAIDPGQSAAHYNLANALQAEGRLDDAIQSYQTTLRLQSDYSEANNNLGNAYFARGDLDAAVACFRRALELKPDFAEACNNLGNVLQAQDKLTEASECFRRALELKPDYAVALYNLGNALQKEGHLSEAVDCYQRALAIQPGDPVAHNNLSAALQAQGKLGEALKSCRRAIELQPDYAEAYVNLGNIYQDQQQPEEAIACFCKAIELKPDYAEGHNNLGHALQGQGKLDAAVGCFRQALELKADFPQALNNMGAALNDQGRLDEGIAYFRRSLTVKPNNAEASNNLLLALQYCDGSTLAELAAAHAEYERIQAAPLRSTWRPHDNERSPERRLRVGFLSADFGRHPVGFFLIRALENLDQKQCEIVCYNDRLVDDELTVRFKAAASTWREAYGIRDAELAEIIRNDHIDILFDLAGHTAKNRLLVFARKPSPIQVTWAGYAGSTGVKAIDYILADRYEIPPDAEPYYTERVLRLPDSYVCYDPPAYAPPVGALPALTQGLITFGSFNNPAKITPQVIEVWAKILKRVPGSRLVLKYKGVDESSSVTRLANEFRAREIDPGCVECLGWSPHESLMGEYNRIDIALDPFPYNGGLTTCEALWMGVPVITCPGQTFASRHSLSHLSVVGMTETTGRDREEYVELAVGLASDLSRLADLRANLRVTMAASPLCDGQRFAGHLVKVLRQIWRKWCET